MAFWRDRPGEEVLVVPGTENVAADVTAIESAIVAGGTGYTANDVLTVSGGTGTAATITFKTVSAGVVTTAELTTPGVYSAYPANPVAVTGGTGGNDATFNLPQYENNFTIV